METKQRNAAHICNLIMMAMKDNDFDEKEMGVIIRIANRLELNHSDFNSILSQGDLTLKIPESICERLKDLNDLVTVMEADGIVHEDETKYIDRFLTSYGFQDIYNPNNIEINSSSFSNQISFRKFMDKYRILTGEELSPVIVDRDFNISFPLYNRKIELLGPLPKTLYVFFLIKQVPVSISELSLPENLKLLKDIYSGMPGSDYDVDAKVKSLANPNGDSFNSNKSLIKSALNRALPNDVVNLLKFYEISGVKNQKKAILLNKELIKIEAKF